MPNHFIPIPHNEGIEPLKSALNYSSQKLIATKVFFSTIIIYILLQTTIAQEKLTKIKIEENKLQYKNRTLVTYECNKG